MEDTKNLIIIACYFSILFLLIIFSLREQMVTFEEQAAHFYKVREKVERCESIGGIAEISNTKHLNFDECHMK